MNRIALPLGLAAVLASSSASAITVPTGRDDINLNVNVLLQVRYEGTFEQSVERSFDSDFFLRRARLQASGTAFKTISFLIQLDNSNMGKRASPTSVGTKPHLRSRVDNKRRLSSPSSATTTTRGGIAAKGRPT